MPSNSRAENQYYGKYRECCVVAHLNRADVEYHENYVFTTEEQNILSNEAKLIADLLETILLSIWVIILLMSPETFFWIMVKL